jgi:hypothetical protein
MLFLKLFFNYIFLCDKLKKVREPICNDLSLDFIEHHEYLKKIFDLKLWEEEAIRVFSSTVASLYATLLICIYFAFVFTELVTFPKYKVIYIFIYIQLWDLGKRINWLNLIIVVWFWGQANFYTTQLPEKMTLTSKIIILLCYFKSMPRNLD